MSLPTDIAEMKREAVVAPAITGDGVVAQVDEVTEKQEKEKSLQSVKGPWHWVGGIGSAMRKAAISVTPAFIVNNSSNILGASHVATEFVMFKSGMKGNKLVDNPSNPANWVIEPVQKIWQDIATNSKSRDYSVEQIFAGNPVANFKKFAMDTNDASHREADRQISENQSRIKLGEKAKSLSLGNPWQTRTTFVGLVIWALSAVIPERKDSDQEVERMATMRTLHPIQYVGERLKQAVWVPEWSSHKRQMLGLGYVVIGACSTMGSWRQRRDLNPALVEDAKLIAKGLKKAYTFNGAYLGTSVLSFLSSIPLLFALDENKGYSTFGTILMGRIPVMVKSIKQKYRDNDPGASSYTAGMVSFQLENALQALIGGAEKLPDGTIVDHEDEKQRAIKAAKIIKREQKEHGAKHHSSNSDAVPSMVVSNVSHDDMAMPDRVLQQQATSVK